MSETVQSAFQFIKYNIVRSLIERKTDGNYKSLNVGFNPKGVYTKSEKRFELSLGIRIQDEEKKLLIEVDTVAFYEIAAEENEEKMLKNFFYVNAPAILFPYVRAYIASLTALSGMPPIHLPTLNLTSLAPELEKNTTWI